MAMQGLCRRVSKAAEGVEAGFGRLRSLCRPCMQGAVRSAQLCMLGAPAACWSARCCNTVICWCFPGMSGLAF